MSKNKTKINCEYSEQYQPLLSKSYNWQRARVTLQTSVDDISDLDRMIVLLNGKCKSHVKQQLGLEKNGEK